MLAAILRLADELADEHSRADNYGLTKASDLPATCLIFHKYAEGLKVSINPANNNISLQFSLYEEDLVMPLKKQRKDKSISDQFLLDEIYERTLKTYVEMQYCGRYMRDIDCSLHQVRVEILIYPHKNSPAHSGQLHYIIGDNDYPAYAGTEKTELSRLAHNFSEMPDGEKIARIITDKETLPSL